MHLIVNPEYVYEYTIAVKLSGELIGLVGNVKALSDSDAIRQAKQYVEDTWQGYRVHPTELSSLKYSVKGKK